MIFLDAPHSLYMRPPFFESAFVQHGGFGQISIAPTIRTKVNILAHCVDRARKEFAKKLSRKVFWHKMFFGATKVSLGISVVLEK
jgi:hypothetical protein